MGIFDHVISFASIICRLACPAFTEKKDYINNTLNIKYFTHEKHEKVQNKNINNEFLNIIYLKSAS